MRALPRARGHESLAFSVVAPTGGRREHPWRTMSPCEKELWHNATQKHWEDWVENEAVEILTEADSKRAARLARLGQLALAADGRVHAAQVRERRGEGDHGLCHHQRLLQGDAVAARSDAHAAIGAGRRAVGGGASEEGEQQREARAARDIHNNG